MFMLLPAFALMSCEKIVSIDLNTTQPQIVIEGEIVDDGDGSVLITRTESYFQPTLSFSRVSDAWVVLRDDQGSVDTLDYGPGYYPLLSQATPLTIAPGRTYTLTVGYDGRTYTGSTTMPGKVMIDSVYSLAVRQVVQRTAYDLYVVFDDPPDRENYYRLDVSYRSENIVDSINTRRYRVYNDRLSNGTRISYRVGLGRRLKAGDTASVMLYSIDKATYEYYRTANDAIATSRSPTALSPANPTSNLSNGALGYFAAYAIDRKEFIIQ